MVSNYRATLEFAKLIGNEGDESVDSEVDTHKDLKDLEASASEAVRVGSFVQWVSNGQHRFSSPRRVLGVSPDGKYAFVEGTQAGLPMTELTPEAVPQAELFAEPPANPFYEEPKPKGPCINFPLSGGKTFHLQLSDRITKEDFARLKKLIELSEPSLVAD